MAEHSEAAPMNDLLDTLQVRSGVDLGIRDEVGPLNAQNVIFIYVHGHIKFMPTYNSNALYNSQPSITFQ